MEPFLARVLGVRGGFRLAPLTGGTRCLTVDSPALG